MKRKTKIGIPRAFLYHRDYILWKNFFEGLGCTLILSPLTNEEILNNGKKYFHSNTCLPLKIYLGHILFLEDKCDYLLIPRISNYGINRRVCLTFYSIYDLVKTIFPNIKILNYNIDYTNYHYEFFEYIKIGLKVNKNIFKIIYCYLIGKVRAQRNKKLQIREEINTLKSNNLKVLIVSRPYLIYDEYLGSNIIKYFKDNNIDILYSDRMDKKESLYYTKEFSCSLSYLYSREIIGSISYYKSAIDGIIFLSSSFCTPDLFAEEFAVKNLLNLPILSLSLEENFNKNEVTQKLEEFASTIKARRENA